MGNKIRKRLLITLQEAKGEYISGEQLASLLNCSRAAIWKHIDQLRSAGFEIEGIRKKGYRLIAIPNRVSPDEILLNLKTEQLGRKIVYEEVVSSTQEIARELAIKGAEQGTLIVAEQQTKGRGRLERNWESVHSKSILLSLILRPEIPIQQTPQLTLLTAVAIAQTLEQFAIANVQIKWPNDILIENRKVAGILTELQAEADQVSAVIIGIGINVNEKAADFSKEISAKATSLYEQLRVETYRATIIQQFLLTFEKLYGIYLKTGFYPIKLLWESYSANIGDNITAKTINTVIKGRALGIASDGALKVQTANNNIEKIYSADIF